MQGSTTVVQNPNEVINVKDDVVLRLMPKELTHIIPETVWSTLSLDQKKDVLRQNNLLEKYFDQQSSPVEQVNPLDTPNIATKPEVIVSEVVKPEKYEEKKFNEVLNEIREVEKEQTDEVLKVPNIDEKKRIEEEKGTNANTARYKFFGYQPNQNTFSNAKSISDDNPVSDSKTWAATLIAKLLDLFQ